MKYLPKIDFGRIRQGEYKRQILAPILVLAVFIMIRISGVIDTALTRENEYAAVILLQLLIFLFPAAAYLILTGQNMSGKRLRLFGIGHLLIMVSSLVLLICGTLVINLLCGGYDTLTGGYDLYGVFVAKNDESAGNVIYLVLAYALLPAVCEEFLFRAVLCGEYEKRSTISAILMPALFFAMLHFDFEHFPSLFFAGIVLSLLMYATRTLLAPIIVHLIFNLMSIFGKPYYQTVYDLGGRDFFVFIVTALFLLFAFVFCAEAARLYRYYSDKSVSSSYRDMYPTCDIENVSDVNPVTAFAARYPRIAATLSSFISPTALVCYVFYFAAVLL